MSVAVASAGQSTAHDRTCIVVPHDIHPLWRPPPIEACGELLRLLRPTSDLSAEDSASGKVLVGHGPR
jgi:hypothetical protein